MVIPGTELAYPRIIERHMTWMGSTRMEIAFQSEGSYRTSRSTVQ
jgi:hypothetical protein